MTISETPQPPATKAEAAVALQVSPRTIDRLIARGQLEAIRVGGSVRIPRAELVRISTTGTRP